MKRPDNIDQSLQAAVSLLEMLTLEMDKVRTGDLPGALQAIVQAARNIFEAEASGIVPINPLTGTQQHPPVIAGNHQWSESQLVNIARALLDNEENLLILEDLEGEKPAFLNNDGGIRGLVAITVTAPQTKRPLAVLSVGFKAPIQFGSDSKTLLRLFADTAASILQNTSSLNRYSRVAQVGQEINQSLRSTRQLFQKLTEHIADILDISHFFMLAEYNSQSDSLDFFMLHQGEFKEQTSSPVGGACARVIKQQRPLMFSDMAVEAKALGIEFLELVKDGADPKSGIFVPLVFRGLSLGVLSVQQIDPSAYADEDRVILELVGHHVALALNTLRLFRNLDGLNEIGQSVVRELDSVQALTNIVDQIRQSTGADVINLFPYSKVTNAFEFPPRTSGQLLRPDILPPTCSRPDDLAALALQRGRPLWADNSEELYSKLCGNVTERLGDYEEREKIQSTAVLPLFIRKRPVGVLFVNFRQPQAFDAPQRLLISSLSNYAAIAIDTSSQFIARDQRRVEQWKVLHDIDREIGSTLDLEQIMQKFLELTWKYLRQADDLASLNSAILILDPTGSELQVQAAYGSNALLRNGKVISLEDKKGLTYWAFKEKGPILVSDVRTDPRYSEVDDKTRSELDIPLIDEKKAIGVISYESSKENAFTEDDQNFLMTLAERAVFAIRNAQVHKQTERLVRELKLTEKVEREIVRQLSYKRVFGRILTSVLKITKARSGQIMLYDPRRGDLYTVAERGVLPERKRERLPVDRGIVGYVFREKQLLNVNICEDTPWKEMYERFIPDVCWELAVPIMEGEQVRGVINVESTLDKPFRERDEQLVRRLADLALIAVQVSERYERAEAGKKRLEMLHEVDKNIIEQLGDPDHVMRKVLQSALQVTIAETGDLHLYENGKLGTTYSTSRMGKRKIRDPEVFDDRVAAQHFQRGIVAHVAETRETYRTKGDAQEDPYYQGSRKDVHSELAVPLLSGEELIGVLNLESTEHQAFDEGDEWVLNLLAGQAVIALQKAHAYKLAEDESKLAEEESNRFRWLSEAGKNLGEITDLSQLDKAYGIVVNIVGENNDGQCVIRRYNPETGELIRKKVGKEREVPPFKAIKADDVAWLRSLTSTLVISNDQDWHAGYKPQVSDPAIKSLVVTPIQFRADYYGILALSHEEENYFKAADIELMKGLAYQLAVTIHRLEAVQAQRDAEKRAIDARMMSLVGKLAFDVTHRLGNDLPVVFARAKKLRQLLLNDEVFSETVQQYFDEILTNVEKSLSLTRQLRDDVGRFQKGRGDLNTMTIPAKRLVDEAVDGFLNIPETIDLRFEIEDDLAVVNVEPGRVYNALNNIVTNAVQAMPDGGRITIRAKNLERFVQLEIEDTGPGIAKENQEKIFDLFYTTKKDIGSGYGLWSARLDSISNGGDLRVESELGNGATFFITLPRE